MAMVSTSIIQRYSLALLLYISFEYVIISCDAYSNDNNNQWQDVNAPMATSLGQPISSINNEVSTMLPANIEEVAIENTIEQRELAKSSSKWSTLSIGGDVIERTLAAVVMLGFVTLVVKKFGQKGIFGFILICQTVMYKEACQVVESSKKYDELLNIKPLIPMKLQQSWWYITAQVGTTLKYLDIFSNDNQCNLVAFCMSAVSLLLGVSTMAQNGADIATFKNYLGTVTMSHFALLFLICQSATWILTLKEFGVAWFLFPALLVIVNDTMAYVFGRLMGKHKLIPNLSP